MSKIVKFPGGEPPAPDPLGEKIAFCWKMARTALRLADEQEAQLAARSARSPAAVADKVAAVIGILEHWRASPDAFERAGRLLQTIRADMRLHAIPLPLDPTARDEPCGEPYGEEPPA